MKTLKYSGQREAIKSFLASTHSHPTADLVYDGVRKQYPNISLGTVYRNLSLLSELGEILSFSTGDGKEHFDGNVEPHYHFICTCCNKIEDIEIPAETKKDVIASYIEAKLSAKVEQEWTYTYGTCSSCLIKNAN